MSTPLLEVQDLVIEFDTRAGRRRVVDRVSFRLDRGEVLGILGESGSGKTMTTMAVLGLVDGRPGVMSGEITLHDGDTPIRLLHDLPDVLHEKGDRVTKNDRKWQRRMHQRMKPLWGRMMTAVFQNPRHSLDPLMTIGRQVEESIALTHPELDAAGRRAKAIDWLDRVQMNEPARVHAAYAHELSGGMCQRAMIAVALARRPRLLIADEPTTGLDTTVRAEIVELFRSLLEEERRSMMYISHDIREVLYLADRVIVMKDGRIVETETADNLRLGRGERAPYTAMLLSAASLPTGGEAA
ncbi:MAG: ABC transporter ATP-binding protein [Myxococcales bacterium]|nr:ABC transporter ATP-binding protein [Myxococcales bacterium]